MALRVLTPLNDPRPRWVVKTFVNPLKHKRGRKSIIRRHARLDTFPYNGFSLGAWSVIEDFSVINNAVGNVEIGENSIVGIGCVIIGPVKIGNNVMFAQHVVVSGLNHGYRDVTVPPKMQPVNCKDITIEDDVWVGANAVITAGVTIGKHAVVGAGSVVTSNVQPYSVVAGNPAKVVKIYNHATGSWEKV